MSVRFPHTVGARAPETDEERDARRALLDAVPHVACVVDGTGRIVHVNRAWVMWGRSTGLRLADDGVGVSYLDFCAVQTGDEVEQTARAVAAGLRTVLRSGQGRFTLDYREGPDHDAEAAWSVTIVPWEPEGALIQHQDVTLQRQAERRRAVELAVADRIAQEPGPPATVRARLVTAVATAAGWEAAIVWKHREGRRGLVLNTTWRLDPRLRLSERPMGHLDELPLPAGVVERVVHEEVPCWTGPLDEGETRLLDRVFGEDHRLLSAYGVPFPVGPGDTRVVVFYGRRPTRPDTALLELVAGVFAEGPSLRRPSVLLAPRRAFDESVPGSLVNLLEHAAAQDGPVLLEGEHGTGKRTMARGIHDASRRKTGPFVVVDCGAASPREVEEEIFGAPDAPSALARAHAGTLVLRHVEALDDRAQHRLHALLAAAPPGLDVRVMATSVDGLRAAVEAGRFREDLYYRLNVVEVQLRPLRERPWEIPRLAAYMLRGLDPAGVGRALTHGAERALRRHDWPGNVEQLRLVLEAAAGELPEGAPVDEDTVLARLPETAGAAEAPASAPGSQPLARLERDHIERTLEAHRYHMQRSAEALGISRSTLYERARAYGIDLRSERLRARVSVRPRTRAAS